MASKDEKSVPKMSAKQAKEAILEFLNKHNRPWTAKQVHENMKGKDIGLGKTMTENVLEQLVKDGSIKSKGINKQIAYWPVQTAATLSAEEMKKLDEKLAIAQSQANSVTEQKRNATATIQSLRSSPKNSELDELISKAETQKNELEKKLEQLKQASSSSSNANRTKAEQLYKTSRENWKRRKRLFVDIEDAIVENLGRAKWNSIKEDLGIEVDTILFTDDKTSKIRSGSDPHSGAPTSLRAGAPPAAKKIATLKSRGK